jgi:hypothetical protein
LSDSFITAGQKTQCIYVLLPHGVKVIAKFDVTPLLCP